VRLPHDSTNNRVFGATDQLRGMSSVAVAGPDAVDTAILLYRRPNDGASWQKSNWRLSPDSAFSAPGAPIADNWGPEAVAGPLAWGCSVGDSSTHIGIIDAGFHHAADVDANVDPANADFDVPGEDGTSHGTQVASVLAARGNNGTGITGMMWNAKLHLVDAVARDAQGNPIVSPTGIPAYDRALVFRAVAAEAAAGARVINLSMGRPWRGQPTIKTPFSDGIAAYFDALFKIGLETGAPGSTPLIVVSAGNDGHIDPYWGLYPTISTVLPGQVLVVASASPMAGQLSSFSDSGSLVDVAAPGEQVTALDDFGTEPVSGTSFAAPLVSGIAGLLFSFDPSLTTAQVKQLVIDGARRGGRTAGGFLLANAYESLRLAAQRSGAPLCGNRVWTTGTQVFAQRDTANHTGELLLNLFNDTASYLNVYHGGHRFEIFDKNFNTIDYSLSNGSWAVDNTAPVTPVGGTYLSLLQTSHDQDSGATVTSTVTPGLETLHIGVVTATTSQALVDIPISLAQGDTSCFWEVVNSIDANGNITGYECILEGTVGASDRLDWRYAFTPYGGKILVAVTKFESNLTSNSGLNVCPWSSGNPYP